MTKPHLSYELSKEADSDLEAIFDYTVANFGLNQAIDYVSSFDDLFLNLSENPELGRERNEIKEGLRSIVKQSHVVFYRIMTKHIRIVRILHRSRDIINFI